MSGTAYRHSLCVDPCKHCRQAHTPNALRRRYVLVCVTYRKVMAPKAGYRALEN